MSWVEHEGKLKQKPDTKSCPHSSQILPSKLEFLVYQDWQLVLSCLGVKVINTNVNSTPDITPPPEYLLLLRWVSCGMYEIHLGFIWTKKLWNQARNNWVMANLQMKVAWLKWVSRGMYQIHWGFLWTKKLARNGQVMAKLPIGGCVTHRHCRM